MPEIDSIRDRIERLVASALESHSAALRKQITEQVLSEFSTFQGDVAPASSSGILKGAIASLHEATTQTDILKTLLDGASSFSGRSGLLIIRGSSVQGWQSRGFPDEQAFRSVVVDCGRGLAQRAISSQVPAGGTISDFNTVFAERFGAPHDGNVLLVPLVIKEKVAALIYADAGMSGTLDGPAIELLVESAALWLEMQTLRRVAGLSETIKLPQPQASAHAVAEERPEPPPPSVEPPVTHATFGGNGSLGIASKPESVPAPPAAKEDEVHTKARRFAKLLVDEIKLYNQAKVTEGRKARDLYDRLREDIEKSRATYERRYGHVNDVDYFRQELVRVLADNDASLLGNSFSA